MLPAPILRGTIYYVARNERAPAQASASRFSEPALLILASLTAGTKHGYAIIADVEAHTGKRLRAGHALRARFPGWKDWDTLRGEPYEERGQRPYRITAAAAAPRLRRRMSELREYQMMLQGLAT